MKLKALKNHIIVEEPTENQKTTKSGLLVLTKEPTLMKAKVVSVGAGTYDKKGKWIPNFIKEGQTVLFSKGSGQSTEIEGKKYIFFKPEDILAILKNDAC